MSTALLETVLRKPDISEVYIGIETELKEQAEDILGQLGLSFSEAVNLFTRQVVIRRAFPVEIKLPSEPPVPCIDDLTDAELEAMAQNAFDDIEEGRCYSLEEMKERMSERYGIEF